jgi:hypothetical protein
VLLSVQCTLSSLLQRALDSLAAEGHAVAVTLNASITDVPALRAPPQHLQRALMALLSILTTAPTSLTGAAVQSKSTLRRAMSMSRAPSLPAAELSACVVEGTSARVTLTFLRAHLRADIADEVCLHCVNRSCLIVQFVGL